MLRLLLLVILIAIIARAFWRVMDGVLDGMRGERTPAGTRTPASQAVQMARDPVCGTFVVPNRAVTLDDGGSTIFFCSTTCRDRYQTRRRSTRPEVMQGRTA